MNHDVMLMMMLVTVEILEKIIMVKRVGSNKYILCMSYSTMYNGNKIYLKIKANINHAKKQSYKYLKGTTKQSSIYYMFYKVREKSI